MIEILRVTYVTPAGKTVTKRVRVLGTLASVTVGPPKRRGKGCPPPSILGSSLSRFAPRAC